MFWATATRTPRRRRILRHHRVTPEKTCRLRLVCSSLALVGLLACLLTISPSHASARKTGSNGKPALVNEGTFVKTLARVPGATATWQLVQDRFGRFAMALPPDWTQQPTDTYGESYNVVAGDSVPRDGFSANLQVTQEVPPEGFKINAHSVPVVAREVSRQLQKYTYVIKDQAFTRVDGIPCIVLGGAMTIQGRTLRNVQMRLIHRKVMYTVTFTSLERYYIQYEPVFARIAATMLFEREGVPLQSPVPAPDPESTPSPAPSPSTLPSPQGAPSPTPSPTPSPSPSMPPSPAPSPGAGPSSER